MSTCKFDTWQCETCTQRCQVAGLVLAFPAKPGKPLLPDGRHRCCTPGCNLPALTYDPHCAECKREKDRQQQPRASARRAWRRANDPAWAERERAARRARRERAKEREHGRRKA